MFRLTRSGQVAVQHSFRKTDPAGYHPWRGLLLANDGNFYGVAHSGGQFGFGTLFRVTPDGQTTVLGGGTAGHGTVFRMKPSGTLTVMHSFAGAPTDGDTPHAALIQASNGDFYGTTTKGGVNDSGTVFRLRTSGSLVTLHDFAGPSGAQPFAPLLEASDGLLYGTTYAGGDFGKGTVFRIKAQ